MNEINPGNQPYSTSDAVLAITLFLAGCQPADPSQPCTNLYDAEILRNLGYRGEKLGEAANHAWNDKAKGHVQYHLILTEKTQALIKAHRDQMEKIEKGEGRAFEMMAEILGDFKTGAMSEEEAVMRLSCVALKTRGEFVNVWKKMIPLLRVPVEGRARHFDTTARVGGKLMEAKGVQRPGFRVMSLNMTEEHKKDMKL